MDHTYAFGGLHAARSNFYYEGNMLMVDVGSYYPSMIINFNFMSRASEHPELYKKYGLSQKAISTIQQATPKRDYLYTPL